MSNLETMLGMFNVSDQQKPVDFSPTALKAAMNEQKERPPRLSLSQSMDLGKSIYEKGLKKMILKEEKLKELREKDYSFAPTLNRKSLTLAKSPRKPKEPPPVIEETSSTPKATFNGEEFFTRNYVNALEKLKKRKENDRTPPNEKVTEDCVFVPKIDENSRKLAGNRVTDLYELKEKLDKKRELKIKEREEKKIAEELRECTFTPQLKKRIYAPKSNIVAKQRPKGYSYKSLKTNYS